MMTLVDGHGTGEGYLASPRDGTLSSLVGAVGRLEQDYEVTAGRRLGVSLEYVLAAREAGLEFRWGSPWIEEADLGPRNTVPAGQITEPLVRSLQAIGLNILCIGRSCGRPTLIKILDIARATGLEIAAVPSPEWVRLVDDADLDGVRVTFESLIRLVDAVHQTWTPQAASGTTGAGTGEMLAALSRRELTEVDRVTQWVCDAGYTVTPLMTAAWRTASLVNAVNAPVLTQAATVLPYHARLASLRAPGALRLGGKEASRHLQIKIMNHQDSKAISVGYAQLGRTLKQLIDNGHPLIGGSGAPGVGLCPGFALREEFDLWSLLSKSSDHICSAFGGAGERHELTAGRMSNE